MAKNIESFPSEILIKIWEHMDLNDLLNSRLVARPWNQRSLSILNNSNFRIELNCAQEETGRGEKSLKKFLDFTSQFKYPEFILPFALNFKLPTTENILSPKGEEKLNKLFSNVQTLVTNFGSSCVCSFEISVDNTNENEQLTNPLGKFFETLEIISEGLVTLSLRGLIFGKINPNEIAVDLQFPRLRRISLHYFSTTPRSPGHDDFWNFCPQKCPLLNEIHVEILQPNSPEWFWPVPFDLINSLSIVLSFETNFLEKLNRSNSTWQLRNLELDSRNFGLNHSHEDCVQIGAILSHFAGSLEKLTLKFFATNLAFRLRSQIFIPFSRFLKLRHLSIDSNYISECEFSLQSSSFPALESIEITYGVVIMTSDVLTFDQTIFPNMSFLTLKVKAGRSAPIDTKVYMENLLRLFPKLCKISFRHIFTIWSSLDEIYFQNNTITYILEGLIASEGVDRIEEIEFWDSIHNYMGIGLDCVGIQNKRRLILENVRRNDVVDQILLEALERITDTAGIGMELIQEKDERKNVNRIIVKEKEPRPYATSFDKLKKIKMNVSTEAKKTILSTDFYQDNRATIHSLFERYDLYLDIMTQNCPSLKEIHFSRFLLQNCEEDRRNQPLRKISSQFPQLLFKLM